MASASSVQSEYQFLCSICLDVFTDPVTTPCGHNYCKTCITQNWDRTYVCKCPLCNKTFKRRPAVFVNTFIAEMADQFRKSLQLKINANREAAKPDEVPCDACTETKLKALKSCLVCLSSYCETHLEPHRKITGLKRHKLIDPVKNLEGFMCKKHDRPLELFCKTDHVCVCQFCTESDHKSHHIVSLEEECEGRKAELGNAEAEVQRMIQSRQVKIQDIKHSIELSKKDADREKGDSVQVFTSLISFLERSQAELIDVIEEKQKTAEKQADGFIKELQQEITELKKRSSGLKQLPHTKDHLHLLLQNGPEWRPTKDWTKVNVHQYLHVGTVMTAVTQLVKTLSQEMEKELRDVELRRIQQYAVDVTLDPDTAQPWLILSEDGKQVSHGNIRKNLPNNTERFSKYPNILGKQRFSSGRFYYEVQVTGKTWWTLGVARESIDRKGESKLNPKNGKWTIGLLNGNEYEANAGPSVLLPVSKVVQKVGVFVDYEEGLVSFYDVETRVHLYSYTGCAFTEKLFPFFSPCINDGGRNSAPLIISPVNHID